MLGIKYSLLDEKLRLEYDAFQESLYDAHNLLEMHGQIHAFVSIYETIKEQIFFDALSEEIVDILLGKDDVITSNIPIWQSAQNQSETEVSENFFHNFSKAITADANRKLLHEFYMEVAVDSLTKSDINNTVSYMTTRQCKLFVECLKSKANFDPIRAFDIADTILDVTDTLNAGDILGLTTARVEDSKREYIASASNVQHNSHTEYYENKVLILNPVVIATPYRKIENQIFLAQGGNGCNHDSYGKSIFALNLYTKEKEKWERSDFLGIADLDSFPEEIKEKITANLREAQAEEIEEEMEV